MRLFKNFKISYRNGSSWNRACFSTRIVGFLYLPCREVSYLPCKEVSNLPCREVSYCYRFEVSLIRIVQDLLEIGRVSQHVLLVFLDLPCLWSSLRKSLCFLVGKYLSILLWLVINVFDLPCGEVSYGYRLDNVFGLSEPSCRDRSLRDSLN